MTDLNSGGLPSGDDTASRRLPLRSSPRTGNDPFGSDTDNDNPFAGTALGSLPDNGPSTNPFAATTDPTAEPGADDDPYQRGRTSFPILLGLLASVTGVCAVLTGQLIVTALGLGCAGIVLSVLGLFTAHRRHVSGRLIAVLAILIGLAAVGLAMGQHQQLDAVSWLNAKLPGRIHGWLHANLPLLS